MSVETNRESLLFSGSLWGHFRHCQKFPKVFTNTYRTKPNLCELNSVGDTLQFEYKFGAWQILFKRKPFD